MKEKATVLRLPEWAREKLQKIAVAKGLPLATATKELICESLNQMDTWKLTGGGLK